MCKCVLWKISNIIPDPPVNNAPTSIWPHTFHKRLIISGIFFIISPLKDLEFFQVLNLKEKKVTKTPERSGLEPKTIRSRILGLSTWAICEVTIAGGKKSIKPFRTGRRRSTCACIVALATQRHDAFVSHFSGRRTSQWWASKSSWDKTLISLGLENTGLFISLAILTSAAPRSICRLGK